MHPSAHFLARGVALAALVGSVCSAALNRTDWEAEAQIVDPSQECQAYDYAPVDGEHRELALELGTR